MPLPPVKVRTQAVCQVDEGDGPCGAPARAGKGMCSKHRGPADRNGDPRIRVRGGPLEARFWPKVNKNGPHPIGRPVTGPCWPWNAQVSQRTGYGMFWDGKMTVPAHRISYELAGNVIPDGYHVDHLCHPGDGSCPPETCRHRRCVNPAHLKAVPPVQNNARSMSATAINKRKTHCKWGHEFTPENTYIDPKRNGRYCRTCARTRRATPGYRAKEAAYRASKARRAA